MTADAPTARIAHFTVRPFESADREALLGLAPRLALGIAPWLDAAAFLAAARGWIETSIAAIGAEHAIFVAEANSGLCAGFVTIGRSAHFTGIMQAYIGELAVREEMESVGIGRALMAAAEAWARERHCPLVVLETGAANTRARTIYRLLGYREESVRLVKVGR